MMATETLRDYSLPTHKGVLLSTCTHLLPSTATFTPTEVAACRVKHYYHSRPLHNTSTQVPKYLIDRGFNIGTAVVYYSLAFTLNYIGPTELFVKKLELFLKL